MIVELAIRMAPLTHEHMIKVDVVEDFKEWNLGNKLTFISQQVVLFDLNMKTIYNVSDAYSIRIV